MDFVLLDWTRMGSLYCLAGAVHQAGGWRIVRPLAAANRGGPHETGGWPTSHVDVWHRWDVLRLVGPAPRAGAAPHTEDVWVNDLRSTGRSADAATRRAVLEATLVPPGQSLFGTALGLTASSAYLPPGTGVRSLTSVRVPAERLTFRPAKPGGAGAGVGAGVGADFRVQIDVPGLADRVLPVKDHALLRRAEHTSPDPTAQVAALGRLVAGLGPDVVVRLGLSRPHNGLCWVMANGFFSLTDPQP